MTEKNQIRAVEKGQPVWVPDADLAWCKARVTISSSDLQEGDKITVRTEERKEDRDVKIERIYLRNDDDEGMSESDSRKHASKISDLTKLAELHEASLLETLDQRFSADHIYTHTGDVLIAINPFKRIKKLYNNNTLGQYVDAGIEEVVDLPPHPYGLADRAFKAMVQHGGCNQSILVSGESGAGKTETTKIVMRYLSEVSRRPTLTAPGGRVRAESKTGPSIETISQRVLQANPLMEAFGNAKTMRNDNSSRFGKLIRMEFDEEKTYLEGANITTYLLEKARIARQSHGERNFHIFYEMFAGASTKEKQKWMLPENMENCTFVAQSQTFLRADVDDADQFQETKQAMHTLGLPESEQDAAFRICSAILHLGDVVFEQADGDGSAVTSRSQESLEKACTLLGLTGPKELTSVLCERKFSVSGGDGDSIVKSLNVGQAYESRDALVSNIYERLFGYIVWKINRTIQNSERRTKERQLSKSRATGGGGGGAGGSSSRSRNGAPKRTKSATGHLAHGYHIGILDIFGFECFDENSFEQLCINYCNEQLQQQFNEYVFEVQQREYEQEGVDWSYVSFPDNQQCIDMIENKPVGLLSLIDEACLMPSGNDKSMAAKLYEHLPKKFEHFVATHSYQRDMKFAIKHFAGEVEYNLHGFYQKNKNELRQDAVDLVCNSTDPLVRILLPENADSAAGGADIAAHFDKVGEKLEAELRGTTQSRAAENPSQKSGDKEDMVKRKRSQLQQITVGSHFKAQLSHAMSIIRASMPHFIRCLKPNDENVSDLFDRPRMLDQLRYGGVLEAVRVARAGYATRFTHGEFVERFAVIAFGSESSSVKDKRQRRNTASAAMNARKLILSGDTGKIKEQCKKIAKEGGLQHGADFQIGYTMVFLRTEAFSRLEIAKSRKIRTSVVRIQNAFRRYYTRKRKSRAVKEIQKVVKGFLARRKYGPKLAKKREERKRNPPPPIDRNELLASSKSSKHAGKRDKANSKKKKTEEDASARNRNHDGDEDESGEEDAPDEDGVDSSLRPARLGKGNGIDVVATFQNLPPQGMAMAGVTGLFGLKFILNSPLMLFGLVVVIVGLSAGSLIAMDSTKRGRLRRRSVDVVTGLLDNSSTGKRGKKKNKDAERAPLKKETGAKTYRGLRSPSTGSRTMSVGSQGSAATINVNSAAVKRFGGLVSKKKTVMHDAQKLAEKMRANGELKEALRAYYHDGASAPKARGLFKKPKASTLSQDSATSNTSSVAASLSGDENSEPLSPTGLASKKQPPEMPPRKTSKKKKKQSSSRDDASRAKRKPKQKSQTESKDKMDSDDDVDVDDDDHDESSTGKKTVQDISDNDVNRAMLVIFFEEFDPSRVDEVETLLENNKGRENELFDELVAEYEKNQSDDEDDADERRSRKSKRSSSRTSRRSVDRHSMSKQEREKQKQATRAKKRSMGFFGSPLSYGFGASSAPAVSSPNSEKRKSRNDDGASDGKGKEKTGGKREKVKAAGRYLLGR